MKRALIGAGGFSNEVMAHMRIADMPRFVDDVYYTENQNNIFPLSAFDPLEYEVLVCIGDSLDRKRMVDKLPSDTTYFTFVHPTAILLGNDITIGHGSIICAGTIITTNCHVGTHCHLNLQTTIGHDCVIGDYFTTAPGVRVSGNCTIGNCVYIGTNASVREKLTICDDVVIGLNSGVVKSIDLQGTYIGSPAKLLSEKTK